MGPCSSYTSAVEDDGEELLLEDESGCDSSLGAAGFLLEDGV